MLFATLVVMGYSCAWLHLLVPMLTVSTVALLILILSVMIYRSDNDE
jgi:hypothetical protein